MQDQKISALAPPAEAHDLQSPHIAHVDVDAFFASVEQVLDPKLRGKPVLVGRGVVASASYEAKSHGVRTAMRIRQALQLCPGAIVVAGQYEHYATFARRIQAILESYTPAVETAALDDFFLDFSGTTRLYPHLPATLRHIQQRVLESTGLGVSIGLASSKLIAAVASRLRRPRSFHVVAPGSEEEFLAPLPVEKLHGIGHAHASTLRERGIERIEQLRQIPLESLVAVFGQAAGRQMHERSRGLDTRAVLPATEPKSISRETTIEAGTTDMEFLAALLEYLAERIAATLRSHHRQARTLALRLRYMDSFAAARTVALEPATSDAQALLAEARGMLAALFTRRVAIRWVGVSVTRLQPQRLQNHLFDAAANKRWYLNNSMDSLRQRFGWNAVFYGKGLALRRHYAAKHSGLVLSTPCLSR